MIRLLLIIVALLCVPAFNCQEEQLSPPDNWIHPAVQVGRCCNVRAALRVISRNSLTMLLRFRTKLKSSLPRWAKLVTVRVDTKAAEAIP